MPNVFPHPYHEHDKKIAVLETKMEGVKETLDKIDKRTENILECVNKGKGGAKVMNGICGLMGAMIVTLWQNYIGR